MKVEEPNELPIRTVLSTGVRVSVKPEPSDGLCVMSDGHPPACRGVARSKGPLGGPKNLVEGKVQIAKVEPDPIRIRIARAKIVHAQKKLDQKKLSRTKAWPLSLVEYEAQKLKLNGHKENEHKPTPI